MASSQKFIARNRAPRVQIEYDVELYGAEKKIQLPFVMGVMSDLSGKSKAPLPAVADRKFLEIDIDNFDSRMKSMQPRAAFSVTNTLTGEGSLSVDLTFEKMSDFSPAAIASKVEPLRKLLEARTQLSNLMTYMDGKTGAEELIERLMEDPENFKAVALAGVGVASETDAAFDAIKAAAPASEEIIEDNSGILDALKADAPEERIEEDKSADILANIATETPDYDAEDNTTDAALGAMRDIEIASEPEPDDNADLLAEMAADAPDEAPVNDGSADILAGMVSDVPDTPDEFDQSADILANISVETEAEPEQDETGAALDAMRVVDVEDEVAENNDDLLAGMAASAPDEDLREDASADILAGISTDIPDGFPEDDRAEIALDALRNVEIEDEAQESHDELLAGVASDQPEDEIVDDSSDILADLATDLPDEIDDSNDGLLADMAAIEIDEIPEDDSADILADIAIDVTEDAPETDNTDVALDGLRAAEVAVEPEENNDALLADMAADLPEEIDTDDTGDILADIRVAPTGEPIADSSDAALDALRDVEFEEETGDSNDDLLAELAADAPADDADLETDILADLEFEIEDAPEIDASADILAELADDLPENPEEEDTLADLTFDEIVDDATENSDDILEGLAETALESAEEEDIPADITFDDISDTEEADSDDILAGLDLDFSEESVNDESDSILEGLTDNTDAETPDTDILADLDLEEFSQENLTTDSDIVPDDSEEQSMDDLLADLGLELDGEPSSEAEIATDDLAEMLADSGVDLSSAAPEEPTDEAVSEIPEIDLDDLIADADDSFDDLLSDDDDELSALLNDDDDDDFSDLLGNDDDDLLKLDDDDFSGLDDLLVDDENLDDIITEDLSDAVEAPPVKKPKKPAFQPNFGSMSAPKMDDEAGSRQKFRIALLGDFSGRGNKGNLETGADLAKRKGFKLDFDTMEDVIMRFRTKLTLPLGDDGTAVEVELNELDDLHPDELFENVEMFNELHMLRRDLVSGRNLDAAIAKMQSWGSEFGDFRAKSNKRAKGSAAPADLRLTDFQNLIGDSTPTLEATEAVDLISRIVGPHIVAAKDTGSDAMIAAVDAALSTAMSSVLHHPDFQTVEAGWRAIELLGRRIEASANLEVVVYDMSVEEFAADLAGVEDLAQTGLYDMLVEKPRMDESGGPFAAVFGLYTWEETPPHAEILARMARICANMDAPFVSAMSTAFMGTKPEDRHKLVQDTWAALREMPEAKYLGLATPRFLLRMPYGKKTEPVDRFDYEEFNVQDGMRSMLFANPAALVAVLLGETLAQQGKDMSLGSIMSLDDMPFHYMTDQYGDQVALPCTERLLNVRSSAEVISRGYMPVISVQGQNMVKLGSFQAVGGGELLGIWSGDGAKQLSSGAIRMRTSVGFAAGATKPAATDDAAAGGPDGDALAGDDDLDLGGDDDLDFDLGGDDDLDLDLGGDDDLDDLLAGFGDDDDLDLGGDDDMDDDLAALLGDL